jgi:hypothetical protein
MMMVQKCHHDNQEQTQLIKGCWYNASVFAIIFLYHFLDKQAPHAMIFFLSFYSRKNEMGEQNGGFLYISKIKTRSV